MTLAITPAAKQMLAVGGLDPVFGARPLKRLVQREVVDAIAAAIIDGTVREGDQVTVDVDKDGALPSCATTRRRPPTKSPTRVDFGPALKPPLIAKRQGRRIQSGPPPFFVRQSMVLNVSTWQGAMQMTDKNKTNTPATDAAPAAPKPAPKPRPSRATPISRAENEDDDGYDPYSDRRPEREPLFEADPWR